MHIKVHGEFTYKLIHIMVIFSKKQILKIFLLENHAIIPNYVKFCDFFV
jgi:hypothetical protein